MSIDIMPFFKPPDSLAERFGDFRSPLQFYSGAWVKDAADWKRRRTEILHRWSSLMGQWPPLLEGQHLRIDSSVQRTGYVQHQIRFKWMPNEWTDGYLLVPDDQTAQKRPAVLVVYYEPETAIGMSDKPQRDFARQLVKSGFVTLSIGTRAASQRREFSLYYPSIAHAEVQPLSMLAYAAANAWHVLANVSQVDSTRVGIMGHSFGGKWAMFASCLFDKFACAVWSDPGVVFDETKGSAVNYWEPWYLGYYPPPWRNVWRRHGNVENAQGLYPGLIAKGFNLHELHALMAPRPFLVSGGEADPVERWIPLNHTRKVNQLLGYEDRVAMTNRATHTPDEKSNRQAIAFFNRFLGQK
ncbi:prolyl oligopeptidase family serine peptidase [Parapedobacter composti]|uniref:prolyl oligopeptidase family serine peptidase n=1 Tax=Parapedobacter composti TaxID=623281 RepID=UPI001FCD9112|nr:prolyl oligopeptidase family serine peptidase [Parapedobacter composti]